MPRLKLIMNPWADRGRAGDNARAVRQILNELMAEPPNGNGPWEASWVGTVYPGQATEYAKEAAEQGYDIVVALGGDGTVHEVANGLMQVPADKRPVMGVIPLGSGNDFAFNVGLPVVSAEAVKHLFKGTTTTVDMAKITDGRGRSEYWDNTLGIGITGAISIASRKITRIYGFVMYLTATLQTILGNYHRPHMKVSMDNEELDEKLTLFAVCNGPREGGGFLMAPDADMQDGILNYVYAGKLSRFNMLRLLPEVMKGAHYSFRKVMHGQAKRITLEADEALPIHLDGEIFGPWEADIRKVEIEILPDALTVAV